MFSAGNMRFCDAASRSGNCLRNFADWVIRFFWLLRVLFFMGGCWVGGTGEFLGRREGGLVAGRSKSESPLPPFSKGGKATATMIGVVLAMAATASLLP